MPTPVNATATDAPLANGTRSDCYYYINGDLNYDSGDDSDVELADCSLMALAFGTDVETLAYLNPSLSADDCIFDASYSYCVQLSGDDSATTTTAAAATSTPDLNIRVSRIHQRNRNVKLILSAWHFDRWMHAVHDCSQWIHMSRHP